MMRLFRYLFIVQYNYRDTSQAVRARILLPIISTITVLAFIFGIYLILVSVLGVATGNTLLSFGPLLAVVLVGWAASALWLIQAGRIETAGLAMSLLLIVMAALSLWSNGIAARSVLMLPMALIFMALIYQRRGPLAGLILIWMGLPLVAYLQSEDQLAGDAQSFDTLLPEAGVSAMLLTLAVLVLWVFAWNLQRTLTGATRIAAQARATAAVGQALARILNLDELLTRAVELIRDRFAFYHVQVFILDTAHEHGNLAASTGDVGHALLAQGYRVAVGPRTVVGDVFASGEMRYIPNVNLTAYRHPELLTSTQTELALPLLAGEEVIGVLDVHSTRVDAFSEEDIEAMRIMATQLSQAIRNAQLFEAQQQGLLQNRRLFLESETNLREIERLNRQLTGQSWREYILERERGAFNIQLRGDDASTGPVAWSAAMKQALARNRLVTASDDGQQTLAVPITVRGWPIGVIEVQLSDEHNPMEVRNVVQAVAERMSLSLENARLFEQARMAAEREQQINLVTARLQGLTTIEDVLSTAISTLGETLGAEFGAIRLMPHTSASATSALEAAASAANPPANGTNGAGSAAASSTAGRASQRTIIPGTTGRLTRDHLGDLTPLASALDDDPPPDAAPPDTRPSDGEPPRAAPDHPAPRQSESPPDEPGGDKPTA